MLSVGDCLNAWLLVFILGQTSGVSYNRPKFCPNATWDPNATTFANSSIVGIRPQGICINTNNTVYVVAQKYSRVLVWADNSSLPTRNISGNFNTSLDVFVPASGDIYVDNGDFYHRVDKWTINSANSVSAMNVTSECFGLFIDNNNTLYCSNDKEHKVVKASLDNAPNAAEIVAGNSTNGSNSYMLNYPNGIFVDSWFNLYVADSHNNRIQLFCPGELNGRTIVGNGSTENIILKVPTDITLDADGYLFIVDQNNNRIVGSGPNGFRCLVGCSGPSGTGSNQLNSPRYFAFDSYGNIFVSDRSNGRIQKFLLENNSCDQNTTSAEIFISAQCDGKISTTHIQSTIQTTLADNKSVTTSIRPLVGSTSVYVRSSMTNALLTVKSTSADVESFTTTDRTVIHSPSADNSRFTASTQPISKSAAADVRSFTTSVRATIRSTPAADRSFTTSAQSTAESTLTSVESFTTQSQEHNKQSSMYFMPPPCPNSTFIGSHCNISQASCDILQPCRNNGTCTNTNITSFSYLCSCPPGFSGVQCQFDRRPSKPNTCWNDGICNETTNTTFVCLCIIGWEGTHCERKVNYCQNVTCQNKGVCRPLFRNYTCECLGDNYYSGRHCEITENSLLVRQIVSRSFGYIAILAMISVALFVFIMDLLKYGFGIDPVGPERERMQRKKAAKKVKRKPVIQRFVYVN